MDYSLAKKLKDAGFLFKEGVWFGDDKIHEDDYPTLSELIEACGDGWIELKCIAKKWSITFGTREDEHPVHWNSKIAYSTPEEAIANLYLALKADQN